LYGWDNTALSNLNITRCCKSEKMTIGTFAHLIDSQEVFGIFELIANNKITIGY